MVTQQNEQLKQQLKDSESRINETQQKHNESNQSMQDQMELQQIDADKKYQQWREDTEILQNEINEVQNEKK